ncbi:PAS/PAC sensor signal transduction histidine kinase [Pseudodesulfovibrio profundus]|uniref:histidine kinase n=1 Tax=Pseudodesulfovibrio profundus TaxID=57320 RepID=A0A2C8F945_9BACT|nr:PAS domain-containing sensor histidine kinase [Pseudodesulfovibrio profundus]MBC17578.1 PAS domain-containing sensor histidine kinase [Desulfovibrio sp.]SOB58941.1 PAS/PAC sensor signal transduction histidine kinase [Pseudodesulfovibrio profundus]|tara:strand:- start:5521 stop:6804 length:1284 start_codon:yes stop_codon:yes gene_type:complete
MKKPADNQPIDQIGEREKLIGLGKRSISKSYYPELKSRLDELELFRALLDSVSDSILVVDTESGTILDASGSTEAMLGCPAQSLTGKPFKDLLPEHIARYANNLLHSSQSLSLETEFRCPTCSGCDSKPVEISLRTAEHQGKNRTVIVARDISERKRTEEALRQSHDELEIRVRERTRELDNANQVKTEFLSMVSHELRTPLTSVLGFAKIIRKKLQGSIEPALEKLSDPKSDKDLADIFKNINIIISEGERLTALINDVLDLAKMEANKVDYNKSPVSPNDFIQRSIEVSSGLFMDSGLPLLAEIEPDMPMIVADENRLVQVMVNLFSNAVKFTESGTVTCRARRVADHIRVSVTDTGMGIPEDMRSSIFDKFTQVETTLSDRPRGTGLGLPISRNIIEDHFGHIWVEAPLGKGSKFIFTLPINTQ